GGRPADGVLTGGAVYTGDPVRRRVVAAGTGALPGTGAPSRAVAVRGDRIVAVGEAGGQDIAGLIGPRTEVMDLRGRALLPGFQDAHVHPAFAGMTMIRGNLIGSATRDEALAGTGSYGARRADKEWIAGSGWRMEWFERGTPSRHLLDQVTGGRPGYLTTRDGHGAWVSSRALELAGIDALTPDPPDGRIERDAGGSPQGTLHEGAGRLGGRHGPAPTLD